MSNSIKEDQYDRLFEECMKYGVLGDHKEATQWWNTLSDEEKDIVQTLPNFDDEVYNKCIWK